MIGTIASQISVTKFVIRDSLLYSNLFCPKISAKNSIILLRKVSETVNILHIPSLKQFHKRDTPGSKGVTPNKEKTYEIDKKNFMSFLGSSVNEVKDRKEKNFFIDIFALLGICF